MSQAIEPIALPFILNVSVNCYLVRTGDSFVLIDTALNRKRSALERELASAGCKPGHLKLIVLTHGDPDHAGNAAYLREKYGAKIAMHPADSGMVERGTMTWNRGVGGFGRAILSIMSRVFRFERFSPDFGIEEGYSFSEYGLDAQVIELPGHSKGNIGVLTADGDLFCGDLLANVDKPALWSLIDDEAATHASVEKLRRLTINTVYPGHGKPFPMNQFLEARE